MAAVLVGKVSTTATDAVAATTVTLPFAVQTGDLIVAAVNRATASGNVLGGHTITVSTGSIGTQWKTTASRASTHNLGLVAAFATSPISSGSTVTVTTTSTAAKRGMSVQVWRGLTVQAPEVITADSAEGGNGSTSYGANASSASPSWSFSVAAQTTPNAVAFGAFGVGTNTVDFGPGDGWTEVADARTNSGSGDRGIFTEYQVLSAAAATEVELTATASGGVCGVAMVFAISDVGPEPPAGWRYASIVTWNGATWAPTGTIVLEAE